MKSYLIETDGGIDAIRLVHVDEPPTGPDQVKIRMKAASLNYRDLSVASGGYLRNDTRPVVPVSDGAGEIVEVGEAVTNWSVGDRVSPNFVRDWIDGPPCDEILRTSLGGGIDGVLAEFMNAPARSLVKIPDSMSFAQAATVPCAAVTAWHALFTSGKLRAGQTVLLLGTGGVSMFALQFAKAAGAITIVTSSSDDKLEHARSLGADQTINYRESPQWHNQVRELTDGRGVDHVVEVGGPGTLERSIKSTAVGGHIHLIGVLDSPSSKINPMLSVFNLLTIQGIYVGSLAMHEQTLEMMIDNKISPIIDKTFPFDDALDAYRHLASQKHVGKVVIEF